jgi:hypothetical protein
MNADNADNADNANNASNAENEGNAKFKHVTVSLHHYITFITFNLKTS